MVTFFRLLSVGSSPTISASHTLPTFILSSFPSLLSIELYPLRQWLTSISTSYIQRITVTVENCYPHCTAHSFWVHTPLAHCFLFQGTTIQCLVLCAFIPVVFVEFYCIVTLNSTLALSAILSVFRLFAVLVTCRVFVTFPTDPLVNLFPEPMALFYQKQGHLSSPFLDFFEIF